jgi:hypothetical protein
MSGFTVLMEDFTICFNGITGGGFQQKSETIINDCSACITKHECWCNAFFDVWLIHGIAGQYHP